MSATNNANIQSEVKLESQERDPDRNCTISSLPNEDTRDCSSNDTADAAMFTTPPNSAALSSYSGDGDVSFQSVENAEAIGFPPMPQSVGNTPAIAKLKQMRKEFHVNSPSDQMVSPCTRKLEKCRFGGLSISQSQPQNILRNRQQEILQQQTAAKAAELCQPIFTKSEEEGGKDEPEMDK